MLNKVFYFSILIHESSEEKLSTCLIVTEELYQDFEKLFQRERS